MGTYNLPRITLRYNGVLDFDGFYAAVNDWAKTYGYMWHEPTFKHKVPSPEGAEQEMAWILTKKVTEFIFYTINFTLHLWEVKDVAVEGRRKPLMKARMYIIIQGEIEYDWQKRFSGSKLAKLLGSWYIKLPHMNPVETVYFDQLYYRIWNLHAVIKKYLDMQKSSKHPYKGYLGEH